MGAALALALILPLRGVMNAVSRIDFISQRLDDYPRMKEAHLQEIEEWRTWWLRDYVQRAQQAAYIYTTDEAHRTEAEKLAYAAELLQAEKAKIVSQKDYQSVSEKDQADGFLTGAAPLDDERMIVLDFPGSAVDAHATAVEDDLAFLRQLQAGLPGYICILRDGELSLYPEDDNEEALRKMVGGMLESGALDPEGLVQEGKRLGQKTVRKETLSPRTEEFPARRFLLSSAAYTNDDDFVVNISESSTLFRFGRKRSWGLWFLIVAIMVLLGVTLWKTKLYKPETAPKDEFKKAVKRSVIAMFMAAVLILCSVWVIQMLSSVNLAQQGATDQAAYLQNVLNKESERAKVAEQEFEALYLSRAKTAAALLRANPQLVDADSLYALDHSLDGAGLRVFKKDGELLASDEMLHNAEGQKVSGIRYYRAVLLGDDGKTNGWVELGADQGQLDDLLKETRLEEVIGDLHILDTLHVAAVEMGAEGKITASTFPKWVGDAAQEHGIHTDLLYDGYEGIVSFDGRKCYSVVFGYDNNFVIVGSENESLFVFAGGVLVLSLLLTILAMIGAYRPLVRQILGYQKKDYESDPVRAKIAAREEYPPIGEYAENFMLAVFLLTAILFFTTKGNPAGLTYNIVRGTWTRGVNAATVTTCIMLVSVVCAVKRLINVVYLRMGKYLSPRSMTICRLMGSAFTYVGTIIMIIYALSMFGVDTTTLVGGVGITALVFTLGANSLVADVLAGIFIIFEGDFTVGDFVVIGNFRGIVTDISMRTTKIMEVGTRDVKIINNSMIKELINQSAETSVVIIDIPIGYEIDLEKSEEIIENTIRKLPQKFPAIIGTPKYLGVSKLPEKVPSTGKLDYYKLRISFDCREEDKEKLTYQVYRALVELIGEMNKVGGGQLP